MVVPLRERVTAVRNGLCMSACRVRVCKTVWGFSARPSCLHAGRLPQALCGSWRGFHQARRRCLPSPPQLIFRSRQPALLRYPIFRERISSHTQARSGRSRQRRVLVRCWTSPTGILPPRRSPSSTTTCQCYRNCRLNIGTQIAELSLACGLSRRTPPTPRSAS